MHKNLIYLLNVFLILIASSCKASGNVFESIEYKKYTPDDITLIHVLTVDPQRTKIVIARAQDMGQGSDTVSAIAKHFGAIAAVNGGFFRLNEPISNTGLPAGALKINNMWHGIAYKPRGALAWNPNNNTVLFDRIQTQSQVIIKDQELPINAMNKIVAGNKNALLSDSYIDPIELNNSVGLIILDQRIHAIYNSGNITIPADAYMYKINGTLPQKIKSVKIGNVALIKITAQPQLEPSNLKRWNQQPFIVSGGPLLIHSKQKINDFSVERLDSGFINDRYARTAVGILPDKRWVFVVVERGFLQELTGLSISVLQDFMLSLGCVAALNLDGGGSAAMYVRDIKEMSTTERSVADVLLVLNRD